MNIIIGFIFVIGFVFGGFLLLGGEMGFIFYVFFFEGMMIGGVFFGVYVVVNFFGDVIGIFKVVFKVFKGLKWK